jgi:plastocyanin
LAVRALPRIFGALSVVGFGLLGAHSGSARAGTGATVYANGNRPANSSFSPANTTIDVGDSVTWTAQSGDHTATSYGGTFDSDAIAADSQPHSYTFQFTKAGIYRYYCREIPGMVAQVTVNDPSGPPPTYEPTTTTTSPPLYHPSTTTTARHA